MSLDIVLIMVDLSELVAVLSSFSNEISLKILETYRNNKNGLNLTDTSQLIEEKTTTVKDHLTRLMDSNLIYMQEKKYHLSYFGALVLKQISNIKILNKTRNMFSQASCDLIPIHFFLKLLPYLEKITILSNQWAYMNIGNRIIEIIKNDKGKNQKQVLKILGWNSFPIAVEIVRNSFNVITGGNETLADFIAETNLTIITDKSFLNHIQKDEQPFNINIIPELKERVSIYQDIEEFNFMLIRYNKYITFFINDPQESGFGPYFIITGKHRDKPGAIGIFDEIFEYFAKKATPVSEL